MWISLPWLFCGSFFSVGVMGQKKRVTGELLLSANSARYPVLKHLRFASKLRAEHLTPFTLSSNSPVTKKENFLSLFD